MYKYPSCSYFGLACTEYFGDKIEIRIKLNYHILVKNCCYTGNLSITSPEVGPLINQITNSCDEQVVFGSCWLLFLTFDCSLSLFHISQDMKGEKKVTEPELNGYQNHEPRHISQSVCTTQEMSESQNERPGSKWNQKFRVNTKLLIYKVFYFMFIAGFGTTFPYLSLYFKQLGLNAQQVGIISGVRPLIQFSSGPFWAILADVFKARKAVLLLSIISWLIMTLALLVPTPRNTTCNITPNTRNYSLKNIYEEDVTQKRTHIFYRSFPLVETLARNIVWRDKEKHLTPERENQFRQKISNSINHSSNKSEPQTVVPKLVKRQHTTKKSTLNFSLIRDPAEIHRIFIALLWLTIIGEFFEAPSFIMTDTAVLQQLGDKRNDYGKTRLFGSLGFSIASFAVGAFLDLTRYTYCGESFNDYSVMFYIFAIIMVCAFIYATFAFKFEYKESDSSKEKNYLGKNIINVLKLFLTCQYGFFIILTWFLGLANGGIDNFLNWYLEDLGACKTLMGVAILLKCCTIVIGFYYNSCIIEKLGYRAVFFCVLLGYIFCFLAYSFLWDPWWAIPIEIIQGFTYGTTWGTCVTYMSAATPDSGAATAQGLYFKTLKSKCIIE